MNHGMTASHAPVVQGLQRPLTIDVLPNELLIKIFADVGSASCCDGNYKGIRDTRKLLSAMLTSKNWLAVICGTPALWREILVRDSWAWLAACLHRSQDLLVDICFVSSGTNFAKAQHILRPHKDRIGSLMFRSLDCAQFGEQIALEEMCELKSLGITIHHGHGADVTMHDGICPALRALEAPFLETLHVDGLALYKPSSPFSCLRTLQIGECVGLRKTIRIAEFVRFLNDCVSLENLDLQHHALDAVLFDIPQGTGPISAFPRLRQLAICGKVEEVSNLLSRMEVRPDVDLWLETDDQEDIASAAEAARAILPRDIPGCKIAILKSATRIMVDVPPSYGPEMLFIIATQGMNLSHKINIVVRVSQERSAAEDGPASQQARGEYFVSALAHLARMFPDAPVETLICRGEVSVVEERTWQTLLEGFPRLRTLVIDDNADGHPGPLSRALTSTACRHLEYMWLCNMYGEAADLEEIQKCVAWRTGQGAPLRRLRLHLAAKVVNGELPVVSAYQSEFARLVPASSLILHDVDDVGRSVVASAQINKEFPFWY